MTGKSAEIFLASLFCPGSQMKAWYLIMAENKVKVVPCNQTPLMVASNKLVEGSSITMGSDWLSHLRHQKVYHTIPYQVYMASLASSQTWWHPIKSSPACRNSTSWIGNYCACHEKPWKPRFDLIIFLWNCEKVQFSNKLSSWMWCHSNILPAGVASKHLKGRFEGARPCVSTLLHNTFLSQSIKTCMCTLHSRARWYYPPDPQIKKCDPPTCILM